MTAEDRTRLEELLLSFLDEGLVRILLSNPIDRERLSKVRVRPLMLRGRLMFQVEKFAGKQAFHQNLAAGEAAASLTMLIETAMRQMDLSSSSGEAHVLVSRKGKVTIKTKRAPQARMVPPSAPLPDHNRRKRYILEEGTPVPFLTDLGVMTADGRVVRSRYDKFRQINRFLEFIEDVLPSLDQSRALTIVDFGCGKSYLTFALYYYLKELKGFDLRVIGLDLKEEVIGRCQELSDKFGFDGLRFLCGDIAAFDGVDAVDMVVTLHACDTATDYALAKAVRWNASVILSVPCCQHELNGQMENELFQPLFQYGILKERMAALCTDGLRAQILENLGYRAQLLEFIDMEHTPKNILIRAVRQGKGRDNLNEIRRILDFLHINPTLAKLLLPSPSEQIGEMEISSIDDCSAERPVI